MKFKKIFVLMLCVFTIALPATVSAQNIFPAVSMEETSPGIQ